MGANLEGSIPDSWWTPGAKNQVLGYVAVLRVPKRVKQQLLFNWAYSVGATIDPAELAYVLGKASPVQ